MGLRVLTASLLISGVLLGTSRPAQAAALMARDQAVQAGYVAIDSVTADAPGFVAISNAGGEIIGNQAVKAGENGRVTVRIDVLKATPTLTATLYSTPGGTFDPQTAQPVTGGQAFAIALIAPADIVKFPRDITEIVLPRVVSPQKGWVSLHDIRPDDFSDRSFGAAAVQAGVNENVRVMVPKPSNLLGREIAITLHVDDGQKGQFEFPNADMPLLIGDGIVDEPLGIGEYWVRTGDALLGADRRLLVPAAGALTDGFLVLRTGGNQSQILGYTPVPAGVSRDVIVQVAPDAAIPATAWLQVYPDQGEKGKLEVPGADGDLEAADFSPDTYDVLLTTEVIARDQSAAVINALKGVVVTRVVASQPVWLRVQDFSKPDVPDIAALKIGAGVHRNVFIPLEVAIQPGATLMIELHIDGGQIGVYEYPGPDERILNDAGQVVRDNIEVVE